jgi:SAM-dependent methyltransferase
MERLWDQRYADGGAVWSGDPNGALMAEVASLAPARVLDVGCGEGADAVWLARNGWDVTALDVSSVALRRAQQAADSAGVTVRWVHSGLVEATAVDGGYELVTALYPALVKTPGNDAERALLAAVAPGGTLLFVHHAQFGTPPPSTEGPGFSPRDLVGVEDVRAFLARADAQWDIETHEERPRDVQGGAGAHFTVDVVLTARRRG